MNLRPSRHSVRVRRANDALEAGAIRDPRPVTRGRAGAWVPGAKLPPPQNFVGQRPREEELGIRLMDEVRVRSRMGMPELARLFHIPNGGKRGKAEAGRLKAQGVRAGVLDYCLPVPVGQYHGLWVELKKHDGDLDAGQRLEIERLTASGYLAVCAWGYEAAMRTMLWYLSGCIGLPPWELDPGL